MTAANQNTNSLASFFQNQALSKVKPQINLSNFFFKTGSQKSEAIKEKTSGNCGRNMFGSKTRPETRSSAAAKSKAQNSEGRCPETRTQLNKTYNDRQLLYEAARPEMVGCIIMPGEWSWRTGADRGELYSIVGQYYEKVREDFGYTSSDYMPYMRGLPESDPEIEAEMKAALFKLVTEDPECERLIKSIGGIFPPPERLDRKTMCYGEDYWPNIEEVTPEGKKIWLAGKINLSICQHEPS